MAITLDHSGRPAKGPALERAPAFQRGERSAALQKSRRRLIVRRVHILALAIVLGGLFFAGAQVSLFLLSWDRLTIRRVEIRSSLEELGSEIEGFFRTRPLGNMLLFDIGRLRRELEGFSWVENVRVQKIFPETLRIEVRGRTPFALLECGGTFENQQRARPGAVWPLPVVRDEKDFQRRFLEKWQTARACLGSLSDGQRSRLASLECSDDGRIALQLRDDETRIFVDGRDAGARLAFFEANRGGWEGRFGPLETVDLRLDGRVILKPRGPEGQGPAANSPKEAE